MTYEYAYDIVSHDEEYLLENLMARGFPPLGFAVRCRAGAAMMKKTSFDMNLREFRAIKVSV